MKHHESDNRIGNRNKSSKKAGVRRRRERNQSMDALDPSCFAAAAAPLELG
jgi:hypothetical protein